MLADRPRAAAADGARCPRARPFVRDVVLTPEEIKGLMAGLLVSYDPPLGQISFSSWLDEHKTSVGRSYANELDRHFATNVAAAA
jgi:hypothetical protein